MADILSLEETRYQHVNRRLGLREDAYVQAQAARGGVFGDVGRAVSSVSAEAQGLPVNIPTVTDDFFHRNGSATSAGGGTAQKAPSAPTVDANSNRCVVRMTRGGHAWWRNRCDYEIQVYMCLADNYRHGTGCGQNEDTYYTLPHRLEPDGTIPDDGSSVQIAACRVVQSGAAFREDGWDGKGGFRCVSG